jgi:radical SAM-linked protein
MPGPGSAGAGQASSPTRGADHAPVVQRLIVRYAKRSRMRFASHRDIARAVERAVRKAHVPIAYSAGFTPHPKISYAGAAPTGTASEAEYLELSLTAVCVGSEVRDQLDAALPDGIDVIDVTEEAGSLGAMMFEASLWDVVLPGIGPDEAAAAVEAFLASDGVQVERLTSKGIRRMDARAAVVSMRASWRAEGPRNAGYAILRMVVQQLTPAVRPDDILTALRQVAGLVPSSPPLVTRLAQGPLEAVAATAAGPAAGQAADGAAQGHVETTRLDAPLAQPAAGHPASACDQLLRGAAGSLRAHAPGSLTGDSPDARDRAERSRTHSGTQRG